MTDANKTSNLVSRLRGEYPRTGAYAPPATCLHGIHPYECRRGCAPPTFEAADEIERLRSALEAIVTTTDARHASPNRWRAIAGQIARTALGQDETTQRNE